MGDVVRFKRPAAAAKAKGKTLCRHGFHKWVVVKERQFDVRQGRLLTAYECSRCGAVKTRAH